MLLLTLRETYALYRLSSFKNLRRKGGKFDHRPAWAAKGPATPLMDALGHTLPPFCSVCRQFFGFIPGSVRVLQISSDNVHPVCSPQFPLHSPSRPI